jgi:hypothetical protein
MCLKYFKTYFLFIKTVVCVLLFVATTTVSAQLSAQLSENNAVSDLDTKEEKTETVSTEDEQEIEEYNIYRKDNPDDPCDRGLDTYDYEKSWYDHTQIYINSKFCEPALWFDNFFANDRIFAEGVAGTYVRWRNEYTIDEEEPSEFKMGLSFSFELPGLKDRLRLTFENDVDEDLRDIAPGAGTNTKNSLGLQLDIRENVRSKFSVSVSLKPRVRFRYRYTYPIDKALTLRLTQEVQREKAVNSSRTLIDIERIFGQKFLFRSSTEGKVSEVFDGVDWLQAFVLYKRINKKTSLSYETSVNGMTKPRTLATNYRVGLRFRKNFHRKWLFYEIAPEMTWPVTLDESRLIVEQERRSKWLLFFRLEIHFGNAYKKRYEDYH